MTRTFLLHLKDGNKLFTEEDLIQEALKQEKEGIKPRYSFYNYDKRERVTPPGWLVYSTWEDGCAVVYKRSDGKMIIVTGWQGDFAA